MNWRRGDNVVATCGDQSVTARVLVASSDGQSLAISYSGILAGCAEMMPLLFQQDWSWKSVVTGERVELRAAPVASTEPAP